MIQGLCSKLVWTQAHTHVLSYPPQKDQEWQASGTLKWPAWPVHLAMQTVFSNQAKLA